MYMLYIHVNSNARCYLQRQVEQEIPPSEILRQAPNVFPFVTCEFAPFLTSVRVCVNFLSVYHYPLRH